MITQSKQQFIGKAHNLCTLLLLFLWLPVSCVKDESYGNPEISEGETQVKISVNTSEISPPVITTRSQTSDEAKIQEIAVLVFQDDKYQYKAEGQIISSTVTSTTLTVSLEASSNPLTLYLIANSNEVVNSSGILVNDTKAVVKDKLTKTFTGTGITYPFPMYGEHDVASLNANGNNDISGIKMLRSIARADVLVADNVTNLELVSVQLFRTNSKIQIVPDVMVNASVSSPSVPGSSVANVGTLPVAVTGNKSELQLYFPESSAPAENDRVSSATCIVVGGKYNGSSTTTYYRIDFNPGIAGHPFGQILRNHKYVFNIKGISIEGKSTPEEAANSASTGITVEVQTWDENSVDMWYEGDTYFSVSSRTLYLRPWAGTFKQSDQLKINTNLPGYTIQWCDMNGVPVGGSSPSATSISNDNYTVSIINDVIQVEAKTNNEQTADRLDYFVIHSGRWDVVITINQYGLSKHMNDLIRVASFSGIGDLGDGYAEDGASGAYYDALRQILNKQFSPGGKFRFGGYHFTELSTITSSTVISPTVFSNYDVILFTYNQRPDLPICYDVLNWLAAKSNRVLIISADAPNTNANLLYATTEDLRWSYESLGTLILDIVVDESTKLFTEHGLFGDVAPGSKYSTYDGVWGAAINADDRVTTLIEIPGTKDMVLGVDMNRRIVYIGETQFNRRFTGGLSNDNGDVTTNQDKLMANLWAWITEVVLSGK